MDIEFIWKSGDALYSSFCMPIELSAFEWGFVSYSEFYMLSIIVCDFFESINCGLFLKSWLRPGFITDPVIDPGILLCMSALALSYGLLI